MRRVLPRWALIVCAALVPTACASAQPAATPAAPYQPTFSGHLTKAGAPAAGRLLTLVAYTGHLEGLYDNEVTTPVSSAVTDADGRYTLNVPLERVLADELFGVAYDPTTSMPGLRTQNTNADEIQAFLAPGIWLHSKTGLSATVDFDVQWDTRAFTPAFGATVKAAKVPFGLTPYAGAGFYDLTAVSGTLDNQGDQAYFGQPTPAAPSSTWSGAIPGNYVWQARAYISPTGIANVDTFRVVAPTFSLAVAAGASSPVLVTPPSGNP